MRLLDPQLRSNPRRGLGKTNRQRTRLEPPRQLVPESGTQGFEVGLGTKRSVVHDGVERVERFSERKRLLLGDERAEAARKANQSVGFSGLGHSLSLRDPEPSCITIISP